MTHVVAASRKGYAEFLPRLEEETGEEFVLIEDRAEFSLENLLAIAPRYIFLPHWSYIIPPEIFERFECIIFHMTDLPFGRGGSPLQNLISRGIYQTKLSALRCVEELDAGPLYLQRVLKLDGRAEEIYQRSAELVGQMIVDIIKGTLVPQPQVGEVVTFKRRRPEESDLFGLTDMGQIYDYIRMLDAEGYPHAFLDSGKFRLEFTRAEKKNGEVVAEVKIRERLRDE